MGAGGGPPLSWKHQFLILSPYTNEFKPLSSVNQLTDWYMTNLSIPGVAECLFDQPGRCCIRTRTVQRCKDLGFNSLAGLAVGWSMISVNWRFTAGSGRIETNLHMWYIQKLCKILYFKILAFFITQQLEIKTFVDWNLNKQLHC